jgi:hypothetical protein
MKTMFYGAVVAALAATPALADFYIVQDSRTKECRIVEERPAPGIGIVIGNLFSARVDAERHMRTVEVCRETTGRGGPPAGGDRVIIDKR